MPSATRGVHRPRSLQTRAASVPGSGRQAFAADPFAVQSARCQLSQTSPGGGRTLELTPTYVLRRRLFSFVDEKPVLVGDLIRFRSADGRRLTVGSLYRLRRHAIGGQTTPGPEAPPDRNQRRAGVRSLIGSVCAGERKAM